MGRDKTGAFRTAKSGASSASAAAMVASMGGGGTGLTFASFDPSAPTVDQDLDPEINMVLKKLSKRDPTTKVKALAELAAFFDVSGGRDEDAIALALPQWQSCFAAIGLDPDRRVREAFFATHKVLAGRVKRQMAKYVKPLMLPWLCARFDVDPSVRSAANASFSAFFPPNKVAEALAFCATDLVRGADEMLAHTAQTLCDPKLYSPEEASETYERCTAATLLALSHSLDQLPDDKAAALLLPSTALTRPSFWKFATHASVLVRAALYTLSRSIALRAPALLDPPAPSAVGAPQPGNSVPDLPEAGPSLMLKAAAAAVLGGVGDKDPGAHVQMWEAVLTFVKTYPQALSLVDVSKAVLPRLFALIRAGAHGSASESFPCLAPLLLLLASSSDAAAGGACTNGAAHLGVLSALWAALPVLKSDSKGSNAALEAFRECLTLAWHLKAKGGGKWGVDLEEEVLAPALQALLRREEPACSRAKLQSTIVACIEAAATRPNLQPVRADVLSTLSRALLSSPPLSAPSTCPSDAPPRLAALLAALASGAGRECAALQAEVAGVAAVVAPLCASRGEGPRNAPCPRRGRRGG
ncbi:hypothetical protein T484DRAFT_3584532 [Baffinella frigidus]|nr:hypothetical protein T484DRAFT_3584532 [Cryptophyta sp. CCMP2293]